MYPIEPMPYLPQQRYRRYPFDTLQIGEGFIVPWRDIDASKAADPLGKIRTACWYYGRRLGCKFSSRKLDAGIRVRREA
jgi:hypothetical protein